ncbi:uncharacterized protein LOC134095537 [Sardina pilchardus]|uniref:uncharacterized protein LOC134095537 n=1 Tax=Sardina pilchardus TaxID=27697 RepID=UPI002E0FAD31
MITDNTEMDTFDAEEDYIDTPTANNVNVKPAGVKSTVRSADVTEEELNTLELVKSISQAKLTENTLKQTRWAVRCLKDWLEQQEMKVDFANISKEQFNLILRQFYASILNSNGESYSISSYVGLRSGLLRYLNDPPLNRSWNIMKDPEFRSSNNVFLGLVKTMKRDAKDKISHPTSISPSDLKIISESHACNPSHPRGLVNKVWFDIQLHFGWLGKEGNRMLTKNSFAFNTDEIGRKYCTLATKNRKGITEKDIEDNRRRMFARPGDPLCPVASLEKYIHKMPSNPPAFYLHPKMNAFEVDSVWYITSPLGVNHIASMLSRICKEAGIEQTYTNCCFRGTKVNPPPDVALQSYESLSVNGHRFMDFPGHFLEVFQELNNQRVQNRLCDCIVAVGNRYFNAHRAVLAASSSYFRSLLCNSDSSVVQQYVVGPDGNMRLLQLDSGVVTPEAFSTLLDMMYSSKLLLDMSHMTDLLLAASYLHLTAVVKVCKEKVNSNTLPTSQAATSKPSHQEDEANGSYKVEQRVPLQASDRPARKRTCPENSMVAQDHKQQYSRKGRQHKSPANKWQKFNGGSETVKSLAVVPAGSSEPNFTPVSENGTACLEVYEFEYEVPPEAESPNLEKGLQTAEASGLVLKVEDEETSIVAMKYGGNISPTRWEAAESTVQIDVKNTSINIAATEGPLKTTGCSEDQYTTSQLPDKVLHSRHNMTISETQGALHELGGSQGVGANQSLDLTQPTIPKVSKVGRISRMTSSSNLATAVGEVSRITHSTELAASTSSISVGTGDGIILQLAKEGSGAILRTVEQNSLNPLRQPSRRTTRAIKPKLPGY